MTKQRGGGLIELIMFIVIVSIALAGIVLVMNTTTGHSADAIVRKQAQAVADSLLEGIESQSFSNIPAAINGVTTASGIAGYSASAVSNTSAWGNIPATSAVQITVTVTDPTGQTTSVTGYRTNY